MRGEKGFSIIELLIVVAIVLIITTIAVPNLLRSKMAANESSAAASCRTLATANATYNSSYQVGYAGSLGALGPPAAGTAASSANANIIDSVLAGGTGGAAMSSTQKGYSFTYASGPAGAAPTMTAPNLTFSVLAVPVARTTGTSTFCVDQSSVVKKDPAGSTSGPAAGGCLTFAGPPM